MSEPEFDFEGAFDENYLYFYAELLDRRTDSDIELIWRHLELEPGMEVLDLACGHGRIANRLAARGCRVTGLDSSEYFLHLARQDARDRGLEREGAVEYVHGDMRHLPWTDRFDRIVNWFTAFNYFDDKGIQRVLVQAAAALKPGGLLGLEMNSFASLLRRFVPTSVIRRGEDLMIDEHQLDVLTGRMLVERTIIRDGRTRRVPFFTRLLTYTELRSWLLAAGFTQTSGSGADQGPLTVDSRRMIVIARR